MNNHMEEKLRTLLSKEEIRKAQLLKELKYLPEGNLLIRKRAENFAVYQKLKRKEYGIKRDKELIKSLARKCYVKNEIVKREDNCIALKMAIDYIANCKKRNPKILCKNTYERMQTLFPFNEYALPDKEFMCNFNPNENNPFKPEHLRYKTSNGIMVRSKSERTIADKLTEYGIIYYYEAKFEVGGKVYYPDFMILNREGKIVLWEHFGLMNNNNYFIKACSKIENYRKLGYVSHTNLICTYEDDMISESVLEDIINRYLI